MTNQFNYSKIFLIPILLLLCVCRNQENRVENIILKPSGSMDDSLTTKIDTVEFIKETVLESSEEVFLNGFISKLAVDVEKRVFIVTSNGGAPQIYIFDSNGSFITEIGQHGRGPGEFESIGSIDVGNDKLYALNTRQQKLVTFSLNDFSLIDDVKLDRSKLKDVPKFIRGSEIYAIEKRELLIQMKSNTSSKDFRKILFHRISELGLIQPDTLIEVRNYDLNLPKEPFSVPVIPPYLRSTVVDVSKKGIIYSAWTEDFVIRRTTLDGKDKNSITLDVKKVPLNFDMINASKIKKSEFSDYEIPENWPVIHTIVTDDEERVWVSTITSSDSIFQWWVFDDEGNLRAQFQKSGEKSDRSVITQPLILIKNNYWYELERNLGKNIDRIVKYKIEFKERE
ncbi:MAG: 6-bladed beta-propeller [Balneola sp.]